MNAISKSVASYIVMIATLFLFQNCGQFNASLSYDAQKLGFLSSSSVFSSANLVVIDGKCFEAGPVGDLTEVPCPVSPTPVPTPPPEPPNPTPTPTPIATPEPPQVVEEPPFTQPVLNYCSMESSQVTGYDLASAQENLKVALISNQAFEDYLAGKHSGPVVYGAGQVMGFTNVKPDCEYVEPDLRNELLTRKSFTLKNLRVRCPNLSAGSYTVEIVRASTTSNYHRGILMSEPFNAGTSSGLQPSFWALDLRRIAQRNVIQLINGSKGGLKVASLRSSSAMTTNVPMVLSGFTVAGCDRSVSPLVVQMNAESKLKLTSREEGVLFDILGLRSLPSAHVKKLISWLAPDVKSENYFITLPDENGGVNGIEELFGDNTSGPDGSFAANGYEALRKWDGRLDNGRYNTRLRDGFITAADPVFKKLRFWNDENHDGIAQTRELSRLEDLGVVSIDLGADPDYRETDEFGNHIMLKSVVNTNDGKMHLMYDVWFNLAD